MLEGKGTKKGKISTSRGEEKKFKNHRKTLSKVAGNNSKRCLGGGNKPGTMQNALTRQNRINLKIRLSSVCTKKDRKTRQR